MKKILATLVMTVFFISISSNVWATPTSPVPEPGTFILVGLGIAGLCGVAYRRRKK